jgi:hypothetical protein
MRVSLIETEFSMSSLLMTISPRLEKYMCRISVAKSSQLNTLENISRPRPISNTVSPFCLILAFAVGLPHV